MRMLLAGVVIAVTLGCGRDAGPPATTAVRWAEVAQLAAPTVPAAEGALLQQALDRLDGDDVPERALEDVIAWRTAGGGLPWRDARESSGAGLRAFKIGKALLERRGDQQESITTVLYLAQRMRSEAPSTVDVVIGFMLADQVRARRAATPPGPDAVRLAPTDAEVRRAVAVDGTNIDRMLAPLDADGTRPAVRRHFQALVLDAPADRAAFVAHLETTLATAKSSMVGALLDSPRLPSLVREMFAQVDAYRAWTSPHAPD